MRKKGPEAQTQAAIMEWLAAKRILAFRMNSGATVSTYKGKTRMIRFGTPGMADILAFNQASYSPHMISVMWIECKAPKGVQTEDQKAFQKLVEGHGHRYVVARSIEDVEEFYKNRGYGLALVNPIPSPVSHCL